jgi:uncharacterized protein DUF6851/vanadium-dependent haloperoxidase-like protein
MNGGRLTVIVGLLAFLGFPIAAAAQSDGGATVGIEGAGVIIMDPSVAPDCLTPTRTSPPQTIVGDWNCAALVEVRASTGLRNGPPIVARALAIAHTCMYDAWAAYDDVAVATTDVAGARRRPVTERTEDNKKKAISFAAFRCLTNLYPDATSLARLADVLTGHGYALADASSGDPTTPEGIGNIAALAVIDARRHDGSNQYGDLPPAPCVPYTGTLMQLGGVPTGLEPLPCVGPGGSPTGPYADYDDHGYRHYVPSNPLMGYCTPLLAACPEWSDFFDPFVDPSLPWPNVANPNGWQPLIFSSHARQTFVGAHFTRVTPFALTSADQFDSQLIIPPPDFLRNPGHYMNNANEMIKFSRDLDETRKLIVEYWADGPGSEFPPGHWALFAQFVSRRDQHTIDQDAKMFFAMHNASFDAAIVAWHIKRKYDGVRPITAVRYTKQGQIIRAWGGPGRPTENILGEQWMPYNPGNNLTPPFPGYFSGHSVFSRSSATVLNLFTGSDDFGFSTVIPKCDAAYFGIDFLRCFGRVEPGIPSVDTTISFATFSDAATQAGLSRLYGGIHFSDDNTTAQGVGLLIGQQAWAKAQTYFDGTAQ